MYLFEPPPFGGIEGLPHFVKFPAKAPSPLDNPGHSFVSLYHAEAKGGTKAACATLMRGLRMAQAVDKTGSALGAEQGTVGD